MVINSGSGNQSITISVPMIVYAQEHGIRKEQLIRGLVFADLMALLQKKYINDLSFKDGEGLVVEDIEKTIERVGRMGREGMRSTDESILEMMIE